MTDSVTVPPLGVWHVMVNTVVPVIGTVAAPPERAVSEKLPSEAVTAHDVTPFEFQKIDVRAASGTFCGAAHMSTSGGTVGMGITGTIAGVEVAGGVGVCRTTMMGGGGAGGRPT